MSNYYEQFLDPCPYCDGEIIDKSYDRGIVFVCSDCGNTKNYPGLLQMVKNGYPIPYSDGNGGTLDPSKVKYQEYYHQDAPENAVKEFNKWAQNTKLQRQREKKLKEITMSHSHSDYEKYMNTLKRVIEETERRIENLDNQKLISQLSYDEWIKFQRGELSLDQFKRDKQINKII